MEYKQLKDLVTDIVNRAIGLTEEGGSFVDASTLVDVGESVTSANKTEFFIKSLIDQLGKMVINDRKYVADMPRIYKEGWEYGAYMEMVNILPANYEVNNAVNLVDGQDYPDDIFYGSRASVQIFQQRKTIEVRKSFTDETEELKSAFQNWEQMNKFVSALWLSIENAFSIAYEEIGMTLMSTGILTSIFKTRNYVKLLSGYNTQFGTSLTAEQAISNPDFIRYASLTIGMYRVWFTKYGYFFNDKTIPTFTPHSEQELVLLSNFSKSAETYLYSDTYHDDYVQMGKYKEVPFWQSPMKATTTTTPSGTGGTIDIDYANTDMFSFESNSSIYLEDKSRKIFSTGSLNVAQKSNIIGFLYDVQGIGATNERRKTTSKYNGNGDFTTFYNKGYANFYLNQKANMVAFVLE